MINKGYGNQHFASILISISKVGDDQDKDLACCWQHCGQVHFFQAFTRYEELHCPVLSSVEYNFLYKHHFQGHNEIFDIVTINRAEIKVFGHYFHAIQMF